MCYYLLIVCENTISLQIKKGQSLLNWKVFDQKNKNFQNKEINK